MTFGIAGGLLLILGAFFVFKGDIFKSVGIYFVADICWVVLAYQHNDYLGMIFISIGMLLGVGAFIKMNTGVFNKTLHRKENQDKYE